MILLSRGLIQFLHIAHGLILHLSLFFSLVCPALFSHRKKQDSLFKSMMINDHFGKGNFPLISHNSLLIWWCLLFSVAQSGDS